jgi:hypothetical protein
MSFFYVVGFLTVGSSIACCVSAGPSPGPTAEEEPEVVEDDEPIEETTENYVIAPFGTFDTVFK